MRKIRGIARIIRSSRSSAANSVIGGCGGGRSRRCKHRRLTILVFLGLFGLADFCSEFVLPLIEGGGAVRCDVAEGRCTLKGSTGSESTEEGRGCFGRAEEPPCEHTGRHGGLQNDRAEAKLSKRLRVAVLELWVGEWEDR